MLIVPNHYNIVFKSNQFLYLIIFKYDYKNVAIFLLFNHSNEQKKKYSVFVSQYKIYKRIYVTYHRD